MVMPKVADTMIGDITLGRIWPRKSWVLLVPIERAVRINLRSFTARTSPCTMRTVGIQLLMTMDTVIKIKRLFSGPKAVFKV